MKLTEKFLKEKGFKKSPTNGNKELMEFMKGTIWDSEENMPIIVYLYDVHEVHFGVEAHYVVQSVEHFELLCSKHNIDL